MTYLSRTYSIANGSTDTFSLTFPYLQEDHVGVQFFNPATDEVTDYAGVIVFTTPSTIQIDHDPASGLEVRRIRTTPADTLIVNVQGKSTYSSAEMNLVHRQLLYRLQETFDGIVDQVNEQLEALAITVPSSDGHGQRLAAAIDRANKVLAFDESGDVVLQDRIDIDTVADLADEIAIISAISADITYVAANGAGIYAAAIQTSADRTQTGLDRVAAAASAVAAAQSKTDTQAINAATEVLRAATEALRDTTLGYRNEAANSASTVAALAVQVGAILYDFNLPSATDASYDWNNAT